MFQAFRYDIFYSSTIAALVEEINSAIKKGAKPVGGVSCMPETESSYERYCQAMSIPIRRDGTDGLNEEPKHDA